MNSLQYWRFTGITLAQLFSASMVLTILAAYFATLGYSDVFISLLFALFPLVLFVSSLFVGGLAKSLGRSWMIRMALAATMVAYLLYWSGFSSFVVLVIFVYWRFTGFSPEAI
ncbi:MAG: hypothetical protein ACMXYD_05015 [Candidatus Woesearchaeota archaeon]